MVMVDTTIALQWMALCFIFLISSIWSERNVKYGYVIVPLMAGFFWAIGWIQFTYLPIVIPMVIMMGVLSYLRTHLKQNYGVFGSSSGLLFKIMAFVIFLQFAIVVINGMTIFNSQLASNSQLSTEFQQFSVDLAKEQYEGNTVNLDTTDNAWLGLGLVWSQWKILWQMVFGFFNIYGTMTNIFHVPPLISTVISAAVYMLTAIEIFVLVFKPYRAPEI
jgi:hypothetical protein